MRYNIKLSQYFDVKFICRYETGGSRSRAPSFTRASSRTPRYNTHDHYDPADYAADRRYRYIFHNILINFFNGLQKKVINSTRM